MYRIRRGDVFYIDARPTIGSEMRGNRPAIIVSNDICNDVSPVVEVVYLTTQPKANLRTHVKINSLARESTALCEQITSVAKSRISDWLASITRNEMEEVDKALLISLGLRERTIAISPSCVMSGENP